MELRQSLFIMKHLKFISLIACIVLPLCISCTENSPVVEEEEYVEIPIKLISGTVDFTNESLTRAGSSDDIYLIQVFYYPSNSTTLTPFAYAVLDDVTNLSVKLVKGYSYVIEAAYLKDGKNDFTSYSNLTSEVGSSGSRVTELTDGFVNSNSLQLTPGNWLNTLSKDGFVYLHPYGEKYYGKTASFEASKTSSITVGLEYESLQLVFNATNLTKGSIIIDNNTGRQDAPHYIPVVTLTPESPTYSNYFWYEETGLNATISYVDEDGTQTLIYEGDIKLAVKTRITVNITLSDDIDKTTNSIGFTFGDSTLEEYIINIPSASVPVPEAIDLGLPSGLKWASFNVGASKPEDYGNYYAWGEVETKEDYSWETYKWCNGSYNTLTKYNTQSNYGTVDNKTTLDPEDDVATTKLGGKWRMPTDEEWMELWDKCTWTWTTRNGVNGRLVTGLNGNTIFLPAADYRYWTDLSNVGSIGYYWSSSLYPSYSLSALNVYFRSDGVYRDFNYGRRYYGQSVRPVSE